MSHYSVGVILKKEDVKRLGMDIALENAMEPFDENLEVEEHPQTTIEELQAKLDTFRQVAKDGKSEIYNVKYIQELSEQGKLDSIENFIKYEFGDDYEDTRRTPEGIPYTTYNQQAKWDWYTVGGRWSNTVDGDSCLVRELPLKKEVSKEEVSKMETYYNAITAEDKTEEQKTLLKASFLLYKPSYYREAYPTFEDYLNSTTSFSTYAILTADGEWMEPGQMGWFGMSHSEPYKESHFYEAIHDVIKKASGEDVFVVVDCHI